MKAPKYSLMMVSIVTIAALTAGVIYTSEPPTPESEYINLNEQEWVQEKQEPWLLGALSLLMGHHPRTGIESKLSELPIFVLQDIANAAKSHYVPAPGTIRIYVEIIVHPALWGKIPSLSHLKRVDVRGDLFYIEFGHYSIDVFGNQSLEEVKSETIRLLHLDPTLDIAFRFNGHTIWSSSELELPMAEFITKYGGITDSNKPLEMNIWPSDR